MNPMPPIIKVCGMREPDNIRAVEALGIDLIGFIFWPRSSRYVAQRPAYLPERCKRVGVFVDEDIEAVRSIAADYALDYIQLQGHESPDYIRALCSVCGASVAIIKAFNIATAADLDQTAAYAGVADLFLFDTKGKAVGGNGEKFDWTVLSAYDGDVPFLLSGGIGPDDAERLSDFFSAGCGSAAAKCVGIDLNSRFEIAPALKNVASLRRFLTQLPHPSHQTH